MSEPHFAIFSRFENRAHLISLRMAQDPEFYALCQDYEICIKALHYWMASNRPEANIRLDEYRALVCDLEEEIDLMLRSSEPPMGNNHQGA